MFFLLALIFFVERGPYRAIRYSTTGDFSTLYAATRCWLHGENPYDRLLLKTELAKAGAPVDIRNDQDINPSVYLPAAMPWAALLAWLPWTPANTLWSLLSLGLFAAALAKLIQHAKLAPPAAWIAVSGSLLFSPTYVGLYDGNPSVIVISLVILAICFVLEQSVLIASICLGIALCFKPQLALCAVLVLALWKRWKPLGISGAIICLAAAAGVLVASRFGHDWQWWQSEQHNVLISFEPGGQSDPSPSSQVAWQLLNAQTLVSYVVEDRHLADAVAWIITCALGVVFFFLRKRAKSEAGWWDAAFFASLTLLPIYHRYYDAQLLLLLIPLLPRLWESRRKRVAVGTCLLVLAFPIQSVFARKLGIEAGAVSIKQFMLLRNQPLAVLGLALILAVCQKPGGNRKRVSP